MGVPLLELVPFSCWVKGKPSGTTIVGASSHLKDPVIEHHVQASQF